MAHFAKTAILAAQHLNGGSYAQPATRYRHFIQNMAYMSQQSLGRTKNDSFEMLNTYIGQLFTGVYQHDHTNGAVT